MVTALGGGLMQGALEKIERGGDLAEEFFLAELKGLTERVAHKCAYIHAHFMQRCACACK